MASEQHVGSSPPGLITILFTDVVGSSSIKRSVSLGRDSRERDQAYLETIQEAHFARVRECCRAHSGREVSNAGDSFQLTFDDPVEAVRCAVCLQKSLSERPVSTPKGQLSLRIGIHSGYPPSFDGGFHGTDVDTAARVQGSAVGGQILVSTRTYSLASEMTDVVFREWRKVNLKGVGRQVLWEVDWGGKRIPRRSSAVLLASVALLLLGLGAYAFRVLLSKPAGNGAAIQTVPDSRKTAHPPEDPSKLGSKSSQKPPSKSAQNRIPHQENPEIKEGLAVQMISLASDLRSWARELEAIEVQLPPVDPKAPIGVGKHKYDQNPALEKLDRYHGQTEWEFMKGKGAFAARCGQIVAVLPDGLPEQDTSDLKHYCGDSLPQDARGVKFLAGLLVKMAQEVAHPPVAVPQGSMH